MCSSDLLTTKMRLARETLEPLFFTEKFTMKTMTEKKREYRAMDKASGKKRIYVTLTAEEYKFLLLKADMAGLKPTPYFRDVALHQMAEKRHLSTEEMDILRTGLIEIRKIGNNINQMIKNVHSGIEVDTKELGLQFRNLEGVVKEFFGR